MPIVIAAVVIGAVIWAIAAQAGAAHASPAQNAQTMNQLLLAMTDPNWQQKIQMSLMNDNDALGLDVQAATIGVAEPSGAQAIRMKVAALQGKTTYSPPPLPGASDDPGAYDLFATGQYQGCDASNACDPSQAKYGSGSGPLGLDAGLSGLDADAMDCLSFLLQAYPDSFAREFPKSAAVQGDPTSSLAQAINAVEAVVRSTLPMLATSLRYKAKFLTTNHDALNTQALAALQSGKPMTSFVGGGIGLHGPSFGPPSGGGGGVSTGPGSTLTGPQNWFPPVHSSSPAPGPVHQNWFPPARPQSWLPPLNQQTQSQPQQPPPVSPPGGFMGTSAAAGGVMRDHTAWVRTHDLQHLVGAGVLPRDGMAMVHVKPRWIGARMQILGVWPSGQRAATRKHIALR